MTTYKLTIKKADGSIYWVEHFNTQEKHDEWLAEEQTRPYWDSTYTTETEVIEHVVSQPEEWIMGRLAEYPSQMELLEAIMEEKEGRPEKMQAVISKRSEVRAKYPKGE